MLKVKEGIVIYVSLVPIDMRKSIDGLLMAITEKAKDNPQSGNLFLFASCDRKKVKGLYWDRNGFVMVYKRLEKGRFQFPQETTCDHLEIGVKQLRWLLAGFHFSEMMAYPELDFSDYF